ncbi:MAG: PEP-CTERM sorting domain-containing protein [Deltaproteobacteria bacterium]|nr:PEP-CTERM sorting domain-containing protein [Deltaproteobacteria bacterium]
MSVAFLFGIFFLFSSYAYAVSLTSWNVTELNSSGDYINVSIGADAQGNTTLTIQWLPGAANSLTAIGIDMFGFNSATSVLTCPTGWSCNKGTQNMSGFGTFAQFEKDPGGTQGISSSIVFVLSGAAAFTSNSQGAQFAAHVRYGNDCSGFVSDGTASGGSTSNADCAGASQVPEPSTLLLLGGGLFGLGVLKKMFSGRKKAA